MNLLDVVTIGETMAVFTPSDFGKLRYVNNFNLKIAGAESNLAIGMKKLGFSTGWISKLGADEFGYFVAKTLKGEGVDISNVFFDKNHSTGLMIKEFTRSAETNVYYYRDNSAATFISPDDINEEYVKNARLIHLTGITPLLSESCFYSIEKIINIAKKNKIPISFDPNIRTKIWKNNNHSNKIKSLLLQSNIVLIGLNEANILFNTNDIKTIFALILSNDNIEYLAVKDGKNGGWVGNKKELHKIEPYNKCTVIDSIGAGDAFNAGFLAGLLRNYSLKDCGKIGAICGALVTQSFSDYESFPLDDEIVNILNNIQKETR